MQCPERQTCSCSVLLCCARASNKLFSLFDLALRTTWLDNRGTLCSKCLLLSHTAWLACAQLCLVCTLCGSSPSVFFRHSPSPLAMYKEVELVALTISIIEEGVWSIGCAYRDDGYMRTAVVVVCLHASFFCHFFVYCCLPPVRLLSSLSIPWSGLAITIGSS